MAFASGLASGCDEGIDVVAAQPFLVLTPATVDFGTVDITQQRIEGLELRNDGPAPARIDAVAVEDNCGGCFLVLDEVSALGVNASERLRVRFRPQASGVATGTISVTMVDPMQTVTAQLLGRGSDSRRPDVEVSPIAVDFGFVPAGGVAVASFTVRSVGAVDLFVDGITLDPPNAPFRITTSTPTPANPGQLAPGTSASVGLRAELPATETGTRTARILVETNVLEEKNVPGRPGVVSVPIAARANRPPVAVPGDDRVVEPFSQVMLDASGSFDQDNPPDLPLSYRWTLTTQPSGSRADFLGARTVRPILRPELAGLYELELVVTDGLGLESEPARIAIDAFPDEAVRIELIWDHPDSDLDLHLIREDGLFCDCQTSVHFRDCARTATWFPQSPGSNPSLDVDERNGFGPENINIPGDGLSKFIEPGTYTIAVHYFSTAEQVSSWPTNVSNATVRLFIFGLLRAEVTQAMVNERDVWVVGALQWPEQTFRLDGSVTPNVPCGAL